MPLPRLTQVFEIETDDQSLGTGMSWEEFKRADPKAFWRLIKIVMKQDERTPDHYQSAREDMLQAKWRKNTNGSWEGWTPGNGPVYILAPENSEFPGLWNDEYTSDEEEDGATGVKNWRNIRRGLDDGPKN